MEVTHEGVALEREWHVGEEWYDRMAHERVEYEREWPSTEQLY